MSKAEEKVKDEAPSPKAHAIADAMIAQNLDTHVESTVGLAVARVTKGEPDAHESTPTLVAKIVALLLRHFKRDVLAAVVEEAMKPDPKK